MIKYRQQFKRLLFWLTLMAMFVVLSYLTPSKQVEPKVNIVKSVQPTPDPITSEIKQFGIKIDKIDVLAPVVKDVDGKDKTEYLKKLKQGVAHFKGTALPDSGKGNVFIFGHSSSASGTGEYSKIFARLDELKKDDEFTVFYQDKEYKYKIADKEIVEATDLSVLEQTKKERLTLMTCWPVGTKDKRLIIVASPL